MKIVLIGFACGYKTSAGKLLAEKLHYRHFDTDTEAEKLAGKSIADIFAAGGEAAFRKTEAQVLSQLIDCDDVVISCGGGSALADGFDSFVQGSVVVWLTATVQTVAARLGEAPRPLFDGKTLDELNCLISQRTSVYSLYAQITVATDGLTSRQTADIIYDKLAAK